MRTVALVYCAFLALALPLHAATVEVPGEQPTIQAGIDAAGVGDTVLVACDTYYEHDIVLKSGVVLLSETGEADCVTIDAQHLGRVLYCSGADSTTPRPPIRAPRAPSSCTRCASAQ